MKEVAARQEISLKYIERIMPLLTKEKLVEGQHGKGGGYRLCRPPEDYSVGEILRITEGGLARGGMPHIADVAKILRHDERIF